jgi:uncharacterized protein (DUF2384 family)
MIAPSHLAEGELAEVGIDFNREVAWDDPHENQAASAANAAAIERELRAWNLRLAREAEVPDDLRLYLEQLADDVDALAWGHSTDIDPYLLISVQSALNHAMRLFYSGDPADARRQMRARLEQMRQVFRDVAEGGPLYEETSAKEIARWLAGILDTSQASLAELLGVSPRTFQRWISAADSAGPDGEDARRIRVVARIANHLRHALTGPGVVRWFQLPHPQLGGGRPLDLLEDPQAADSLATLAASARSHTAA